MSEVRCFLVEKTGVWFEEAVTSCVGRGHHRVVVEQYRHEHCEFDGLLSLGSVRWPESCSRCGCAMERGWLGSWHMWRDSDGREERGPQLFGPGAMFDADWNPWKGEDGRSLTVVLPDAAAWCIDGYASDAPRRRPWSRQGVPPLVTAQPSIVSDGYHGWLRNGVLVDA